MTFKIEVSATAMHELSDPPDPEPWGKLDRRAPDPAQAPRLSLVAHCIDVAAVTQALLSLPTWRARLETLAQRPLAPSDLARLCALAFLHDVGKAGAGFYAKALPQPEAESWRRSARAGGAALGHVAVVAPLFEGDRQTQPLRDALGVDAVLAWGGSATGQEQVQSLWLAAISHHGSPQTRHDLAHRVTEAQAAWDAPIAGYQPLQGLARLQAAVRRLLPAAFAPEAPPLRAEPPLVHAFAGLVSLADWIASNTDSAFFPYDLGLQDEARWPLAQRRATEVLRAMRLDLEAARADLRQRRPGFETLFDGHAPREVQQVAGRSDLGPLVVVEAETGSGKTEAALWRFKALFEAGQVDALCFLLPTRVSATAIAQRVQAFVERLFPDPVLRPNTVLAVPGYLRANGQEGQPLAGFEVQWPDEPARRPLYWAAEHGKRYFAAACATGTIDQFLLSVLQTKHAHLRGTALLRALVLVDEVHASDAYMTALLRAALQRHVRAGGHGLLMSATLTGEARNRLLQAGQRKRGWGPAATGAQADATEAPYPCVADARTLVACQRAAPQRRITRSLLPAMRDPARVAEHVADAVAAGARVLVLRNTVAQALATQAAIEQRLGAEHPALFRAGPAGVAAMHHGRYAFEDRRCLDAAVEQAFGKPAVHSREACVLVGTQTLEISLDCDADLMVTDLAPIDVLLQRLGRLQRHRDRDAWRPAGYRSPHVVVLTPAERDLSALLRPGGGRGLGLGRRSAYANLVAIEACLRLLEDTQTRPEWLIPDHNRGLVEAGADGGRLHALADELGGDWPAAYLQYLGEQAGQRGQAAPLLVDWDKDWDQSDWSDLGDLARTRLGLDGVDIDLPQAWTSPLGQPLTQLTLPRWMLPKLAATATTPPALDAWQNLGAEMVFQVAGASLRYDRLGLRPA